MADERDKWLDQDTAERLLRGEPVEVAGEHARKQAEQLSGALRALTVIAKANDSGTPGEAAALAAFQRTRKIAAPRRNAVVSTEVAGAGNTLGTVRLAPAARPAASASSFGRPLRRGFAAAAAVCALCTVAVAAGTGVLHVPFASKRNPLPANSVSTADSGVPRPLLSQAPDSTGPSDSPSTTGTGGFVPDSPPSAGAAGNGGAKDAGSGRENEAAGPKGTPRNPVRGQSAQWYLDTLDVCRDYLSGEIDRKRKKALESTTEGAEGAERFCDRILDGRGGGKGRGGSKGEGNGTKSGDGAGHGNIAGGGTDSSPSAPPVDFPPPTPAGPAQPGTWGPSADQPASAGPRLGHFTDAPSATP